VTGTGQHWDALLEGILAGLAGLCFATNHAAVGIVLLGCALLLGAVFQLRRR
jgi:hypothetical protein